MVRASPVRFVTPAQPNPRDTQYFELHGHRALWHDGWKAVTFHQSDASFDEDRWELYHLTDDFAETRDLAREYPQKLADLKDLWWREARAYGVLPLDGRDPLKSLGTRAQPPGMLSGRASYSYFAGQEHLPAAAAPNLVNRSFSITALVDRPDRSTEGVLVARGDRNGGFSFLRQGRPARLRRQSSSAGAIPCCDRSARFPSANRHFRFEYARVGPGAWNRRAENRRGKSR